VSLSVIRSRVLDGRAPVSDDAEWQENPQHLFVLPSTRTGSRKLDDSSSVREEKISSQKRTGEATLNLNVDRRLNNAISIGLCLLWRFPFLISLRSLV
jgi:hypothetical protein